MTLRSMPLYWGLVLGFLCTVLAACGGPEADPETAVGCRLNSDCPFGEVCEAGACVEDDTLCDGGDCPCTDASDCEAGQGCDQGLGQCFALECVISTDCALGSVCEEGRCATDLTADRDRDGIPDNADTCPSLENADQEDNDVDGQGDACDLDDDNDAIPDAVDNCPFTGNVTQGDANGDGLGNACDDAVSGIDVMGVLDFSALPGSDTAAARVFVSGSNGPVGIDPSGAFEVEDVLTEPGRFLLRVEWPGFEPVVREFVALDGALSFEVPTVVLSPAGQGDGAVVLRGRAFLEGARDHRGVVVRARVGGSLVETGLTDPEGRFELSLGPVNHTLEITRAGYEALQVQIQFNTQGDNAGRFTLDGSPLDEVDTLILPRLTGQVQVTVQIEPDWVPSGQREVSITIVGGGQERSAVAGDSPVVFTELPAADYIVFADRPGFSQGRQAFTLDEQQLAVESTLRIALIDLAQANLDLSGLTLTGRQLRAVPSLRGANLAGVRFVGEGPDQSADLCGLNLSGVSLVGADMRGSDLSGATLVGARMDNTLLQGAVFRASDLSGASLFGANLTDAALTNGPFICEGEPHEGGRARLTDANLSNAVLVGARFVDGDDPTHAEPCTQPESLAPELSAVRWSQADLTGAILHSADLTDSVLSLAVLEGADLRGACLAGATISRSDLTDARLQGADMTDASIFDALMLRTLFDGALMAGVGLSGVNLTDAVLDGIDGQGMTIAGSVLSGASLVGAQLEGSDWVGELLSNIDLSSAVLDGADMRNAQFIDVVLSESSFIGADLRNISMVQLQADGADFRRAQLNGADLAGTSLEGADLRAAVLLGADFQLARYDGETRWPADFEYRTIEALGPESILDGFLFPGGFSALGVDLTGASLVGARLAGVDLTGALLTEAALDGTDLNEANLLGVSMAGATLVGVRASRMVGGCPDALPAPWLCVSQSEVGRFALVGPEVDLSGVDLSGTDLGAADLEDALTSGLIEGCPLDLPNLWSCHAQPGVDGFVLAGPSANLSRADLTDADLSGANLRRANLRFANLGRIDLGGANLSAAEMVGVNFSNANLRSANFQGADLSSANLRSVDLRGADLRDASLNGAALRSSDMSTTDLDGVNAFDLISCPSRLPLLWRCVPQVLGDLFVLVGP